ncbi:ISAs1-like element ISEc26 family transposase [Draconibacterium sp.]|jgi:predicted transposase YbfD/YdcC
MTTTAGPEVKQTHFESFFSELKDPRRTNKGNLRHLLSDILFLTISAMLCGAGDWELVRTFGEEQLTWLRKFGTFANGAPSTDTLERVFAALNPKAFNNCFVKWINAVKEDIQGETVAIDGKTMRGAKPNKTSKDMPHIVSAFASANGLCLGQVKTGQKSNEITAIPELLEMLAIKGCTVTIDAMGCQTDIAAKIISCKADYILAVKGNQGNLERAISDTVLLEKHCSIDISEDFGHGRIEQRTCRAYSCLGHIEDPWKWAGLQTIFVIDTHVYEKATGKTSTEQRFYISSLPPKAQVLNTKTREHWSIENKLHWSLDVQFGEDRSRKYKGDVAENFNILLKSVMTLLLYDKTPRRSKNNKRMKAALNPMYREKLLGF